MRNAGDDGVNGAIRSPGLRTFAVLCGRIETEIRSIYARSPVAAVRCRGTLTCREIIVGASSPVIFGVASVIRFEPRRLKRPPHLTGSSGDAAQVALVSRAALCASSVKAWVSQDRSVDAVVYYDDFEILHGLTDRSGPQSYEMTVKISLGRKAHVRYPIDNRICPRLAWCPAWYGRVRR